MRILVVYDCLFPWTVGGAERWYRNLAERLAGEGHEVTYLTMRQWDRDAAVDVPGVRVVSCAPRMALYSGPGQRRVAPPLVFGAGVLWWLLRHGRRFDVVHTASFPYFSLLAAAVARPVGRFRLVVDWHELWTREYWREYLGRAGGWVGWTVQKLCLKVRQRAFCFARLTAGRLCAEGLNGEVTVLEGEYAGDSPAGGGPAPAEDVVVFAGRHIPEKRAPLAVEAIAMARRELPGLRGIIFGDGPERDAVAAKVHALGLSDAIDVPGFVAHQALQDALSRALCLLHPSAREGYGLVVVESAVKGVPVVLAAGEDNAAVELVEEGVNGFVAPEPTAEALAAAIVRVAREGDALRESTAAWYAANARRLSIDASLEVVAASYA